MGETLCQLTKGRETPSPGHTSLNNLLQSSLLLMKP